VLRSDVGLWGLCCREKGVANSTGWYGTGFLCDGVTNSVIWGMENGVTEGNTRAASFVVFYF
jgi:hypothetical protein